MTDDKGKLAGYAMTFLTASHPIRAAGAPADFIERIAPWALDSAVADRFAGVLALHNHDLKQPLGSVDSGTLNLRRDGIGLRFDLPVNEVAPLSGYVYQRVRDGKGTGMSFGFRATADRWHLDSSGNPVRLINGMTLYEVSVLTQPKSPAYPSTVLMAIVPASQRNARVALAQALALAA